MKAGMKTEDMREYVYAHIGVGQSFLGPRDSYNAERDTEMAEKTVTMLYPHFVQTVDEYGRVECFLYQDIYELLRKGYRIQEH